MIFCSSLALAESKSDLETMDSEWPRLKKEELMLKLRSPIPARISSSNPWPPISSGDPWPPGSPDCFGACSQAIPDGSKCPAFELQLKQQPSQSLTSLVKLGTYA
jgi:hypothetical protein